MTAWIRIFFAFLLCFSFLTGCSDNKDKKEKSTIEQTTDKAAAEAVQSIKVPLEKAQKAAEQENAQTRQMEKQAGNK